jgi:hypothetical protein
MRFTRARGFLLGGAFAALCGATLFFFVEWEAPQAIPASNRIASEQPSSPAPAPPPMPHTAQLKPERTPSPRALAFRPPATEKQKPTLPAPVSPAALSARYDEIVRMSKEDNEALQGHINADPELSEVLKAKVQQLQAPLQWITLAQALNDPVLKPAVMHALNDEKYIAFNSAFINATADSLGIQRPPQSQTQTGEQLATRLQAIESKFQADYQRLVEKLQIEPQIADLAVRSSAGDQLYPYLAKYMKDQGWTFDISKRRFIPPSKN